MSDEAKSSDEGEGRRRGAVRRFLVADRPPMWFTAFALLFGASGSYVISPLVNSEYEAQKIKTDFVIRNYNDLRAKMEDFQSLYVTTTQRHIGGEDIRGDVLRLQELIARVGAQNIAMMPMFASANGPKAAAEVQTAMNAMVNVIFSNAHRTFETDEESVAFATEAAQATQGLVPPLMELYVQIGQVGRLRPTDTSTDLQEE